MSPKRGIQPSAVSFAETRPRTRSTIHLRTRMFSPKPGHMNSPFSFMRNQFHAEDARGLVDGVTHLQPVVEVIAHVVAAERQHGERVAADNAPAPKAAAVVSEPSVAAM